MGRRDHCAARDAARPGARLLGGAQCADSGNEVRCIQNVEDERLWLIACRCAEEESKMADSIAAQIALIVGAGSGLSASLARLFARKGMKVAVAARSPGKLDVLARETGARAFACDAIKRSDVTQL